MNADALIQIKYALRRENFALDIDLAVGKQFTGDRSEKHQTKEDEGEP